MRSSRAFLIASTPGGVMLHARFIERGSELLVCE